MLDELHSDELDKLNKKRELLEQLLAFTKQINQVGSGLDLVREMAKPSQRVNKRLFKLLLTLIERLEPLSTEELKTRLTNMDAQVQKELNRMMVLSRMSEDEFFGHFAKSSAGQISATYEALMKEIEGFRRKAQTNVAIRYILSQRGALMDACSLPISQDALGEAVESLRTKEAECKRKVEKKIEDMIADTDLILSSDKYPEELKSQLQLVRENLDNNLARLRAGETVSEVFVSVDAFEIGEGQTEPAPKQPSPQPESEAQPVAMAEDQAQDSEAAPPEADTEASEKIAEPDLSTVPRPFIGIALLIHDLKTWLSSPWAVSWRSIRAKSRLRNKQRKRQQAS